MCLPQPVLPVGQHRSGELFNTPIETSQSQTQFLAVYSSSKKEAFCGLQRFKFTIKIRFSFFPPLLPIISKRQAWHVGQVAHKASKWVLHGNELRHFCHSKNACLKGRAVLCKHLFDRRKFVSLPLEWEHYSFFLSM